MADSGVARQVISTGYREIQESLHQDPSYGTASHVFAPIIAEVIRESGLNEILDYGAGKGRLKTALVDLIDVPVTVAEYDPGVEEKSDPPEPADMVVCLDVLEHIEPDLLDNVLDDLKRLTKFIGVLTVNYEPAKKFLPDGRNAHLIVESQAWWLPRIMERFHIQCLGHMNEEIWMVVTPWH